MGDVLAALDRFFSRKRILQGVFALFVGVFMLNQQQLSCKFVRDTTSPEDVWPTPTPSDWPLPSPPCPELMCPPCAEFDARDCPAPTCDAPNKTACSSKSLVCPLLPPQECQVVRPVCDTNIMQAPEQYADPTLVDSDPKLCVIVRTYLPQAKSGKLFSLLFSFLAKHPPNVHITLVNTDSRLPEESVRTFSAVRDDINSLFGRRYVDISPITSDKVLAKHPNANSGDLQYLTADEVMELLLNSADPDQALSWSGDTNYAAPPAKKSFCKYFLVTNGDNLYAARFLSAVTLRMRENVDLIGTDFISRYYFPPDD